MAEKIKSGQEILNDFFVEIASIEGIDQNIVNVVTNLYREGKLTDTNLSNELTRIREESLNED